MEAKSPKKYPFTLSDISDLLDLKLGIFSDKFDLKLANLKNELIKKINDSETGIIAEMDKRFADVDKRFADVDKRFADVDKRFADVDKRFDTIERRLDINDNTHQEILGAIDEMTDKKIEKHVQEKHSFIPVQT